MYFKRLEIQGFKSFAEPVIIDFHDGITCIVGPNGSGKSNFSDAIRWVLGEQSARLLRAGKMEEIIFNGAATRKSRGMAEATLVIDNTTGILPIEYNEVAITRRLYRSGESEYMINNNPCRLRDIKELIMDTGIGVDGYSIIGQGKISEILSSKPESRREIFEEAAGVVMYKSKKQDAEKKLSVTDANLERVNDVIAEIEGRIDTLKVESEKAKEYIELREKRKELDINITLRNVEKIEESTTESADQIKQLDLEIANLKAEKESCDGKVNLTLERSRALESLYEEAQGKFVEVTEKLGALTSDSKVDSVKREQFKQNEARLNKEIEEIQAKLDAELAKIEEQDQIRSGIYDDLDKFEDELRNAIGEYNEVNSKSIEISEAITDLNNDLIDINEKIAKCDIDIKGYETFVTSLEEQKAMAEKEVREVAEGRQSLVDAISEVEAQLKDLGAKLQDNSKTIALRNDELQKANDAVASLTKESEKNRIALERLTARKNAIEEMEANYDGYNYGVKFVMNSKLDGIHGTVAELISVPKGYETAMETALSGSIQNIVCDKDNDAKHAINLLKENRAGRVTFLPIESVHGNVLSVNQTITSARGYLGIASDLAKYDQDYSGIMTYLLGRTLIVDNMDTAVRLSKMSANGARFVTLDGEIVAPSGAMTGGRTKNQGANILSRKAEIGTLGEEIKKYTDAWNNSKAGLEKQVQLAASVTKTLEGLKAVATTIASEQAGLKAKLAGLNESDSANKESDIRRERNLNNIKNDITNALKAKDDTIASKSKLVQERSDISDEIEQKIQEADSVKEELSVANDKVTQARVAKAQRAKDLDSIDSVIEVFQDNIDALTEEIDAKQDQIEEINEERLRLSSGSGDFEEQVKKLEVERLELEESISKTRDDKEKVSSELTDLLNSQSTLSSKIEILVGEKQDLAIHRTKYETQLENAKERLWNDYEISYAQALTMRKEDFVYSTAVKENREIKARIDALGEVNTGSIKEYETVSERYGFLTEQREDILAAEGELKSIISEMDQTIKSKFKQSFDDISKNFEEIFKELFDGGEAEISLTDENNPLESGIDINVQPPGKRIENISAFSGGEQTMIALALMLAVLKSKPTPFCILDEVEAALDDNNIDKFANSLKKFEDVQFAVITHQKTTMEHADVLYGVTMPERGVSKVLSLRLKDMDEESKKLMKALDADKKNDN